MGVKANEEVGATGIPDQPRLHARSTRVEDEAVSSRKGLAPVVLCVCAKGLGLDWCAFQGQQR